MEYSVHQLAELSGVSSRTLRYYDQIGLLTPGRNEENGYRMYGEDQVDRLQQILFYRELGVSLEEINTLLNHPGFDRQKVLQDHLSALREQREQLDALIHNVDRTLRSLRGELVMKDTEKFEGLKKALIEKNEEQYGAELRGRFGNSVMDRSNQKFAAMSQKDWNGQKELEAQILETLREAMKAGDAAGPLARKLCRLHREWLCGFWPEGTYSPAAHRQLAQGYVSDERFRKYYDNAAGDGAAEFLKCALDACLEKDQ